MTIEDPKRFVAGLWDWKILNGCFGDTKIAPTDLDGFVERNGFFLTIETKSPGVEVKQGQQLTFERRVQSGVDTVIVVWGETNKPQQYQIFAVNGISQRLTCNLESFRDVVRRWFEYAELKKPIVLIQKIATYFTKESA